ncbi:MAG: polyisoprenyl-teichoic acid--peptidoglycan teichoic acid transferase [Thermomicrobiales bacterium]|jgi:LCP family protein required for cell wall assembly|nr:polyisoprenyl-teichoic acid--peptidoglycan teichoic acid transferase [Thermomicrobiales bacterium]
MATAHGLDRRLFLRLVGGGIAGGLLVPLGAGVATAAQDDTKPADLETLTVVVGGLDTRRPGEPENSDVIILARADFSRQSVRAISIPRDLYLEIPGFGYDKITRAYDFGSKADNGAFKGGAATVSATIAANFGVELDGVVMTTFEGFVKVVDALGGVDVVNPYDLYDGEYPTLDYGYTEIFFPAGPIHLNGEEALQFVRTRHQDGDDARVMRQQLVIRALLERARDPEIAPKLPSIVKKLRKAVRTDLNASEQLALALAAPSFTNDGVSFATLNGLVYPDTAPGGMWIYSGDWSQIPGYVQGFLNGEI